MMRLWVVQPRVAKVLVSTKHVDMRSWPGKEQLRCLGAMGHDSRVVYFEFLAIGLKMPELDIAGMVDRMHTVRYQTSAPGYTKTGMGPSCDYCIDLAIKDGTHREVEWTNELWIVLLFFQQKADRTVVAEFDGATYKKGDVLHAIYAAAA